MSPRTVLAAVLLVLLGVGGSSAAPQGELRVAIPWTPENLDPTMNLSSIRAAVGASMFDSLVGRDPDGKLVPELAESWKNLDDLTWQFKLRRGVSFHDGEPFNAEAVRFTIRRVLDPEQKSPNRANIAEIARVDLLTGLPTRPHLEEALAPALSEGRPVALLLIDIDQHGEDVLAAGTAYAAVVVRQETYAGA